MKRILFDDAERTCKWVCDRTGGEWLGEGKGISLLDNDEIVAGVMYDMFNGKRVAMHVAATGKTWMNREFLFYAFAVPFYQWGVKKILGLVDSENEQALKFDLHLGFVEEARIKDAGKVGDLVILTMTPEQCRFIQGRYNVKR